MSKGQAGRTQTARFFLTSTGQRTTRYAPVKIVYFRRTSYGS